MHLNVLPPADRWIPLDSVDVRTMSDEALVRMGDTLAAREALSASDEAVLTRATAELRRRMAR